MGAHPRQTRLMVHNQENIQLKSVRSLRRPPPLSSHFPMDHTAQLVYECPLDDRNGKKAVPHCCGVGGEDCYEDELGVYEAKGLANLWVRFPKDLGDFFAVRAPDLEAPCLRD